MVNDALTSLLAVFRHDFGTLRSKIDMRVERAA
jgi:hypothetical protein